MHIFQKNEIFAAIVLLFIVCLAGWIGYKNDTIIEQKTSSMTMIQTLSASLKALPNVIPQKLVLRRLRTAVETIL